MGYISKPYEHGTVLYRECVLLGLQIKRFYSTTAALFENYSSQIK